MTAFQKIKLLIDINPNPVNMPKNQRKRWKGVKLTPVKQGKG